MSTSWLTRLRLPRIKFSNPFKKTADPNEPVVPKIKLRTKALTYLKNIYTDYKEVALDTARSADEKPFKALGYGILLTAALVFYKKNPTRRDYESTLIELGNEIIMCGQVHSARSEYYLDEVKKLINMGLIEYRSFVFFSLIMIRKFNESDCNYESHCAPLLNPNKLNVFNVPNLGLRSVSRIVDIGFLGQWRYLSKYFRDFDVDEREWIGKK